ncbi:MAG: TIGR04283 family arsenosugar biosynthesis glycosyltransferase [Gammaproteobacteria bacterium]|nr:TIGR04283 family arsenosugar biosynthesis glycosyltransferase [Gammaproteobacteria bacterium]
MRDDAACLQAQRETLRDLREQGCQVVIVDGESIDQSLEVARGISGEVLVSPPGRARQMNAGAAVARGDILLFLHADTEVSAGALAALDAASGDQVVWGRFDVRLRGEHWYYRVVETMMNLRSRLTGIATGDQAMFVSRELFHRIGGFPEIPLMEDIALSRRLRGLARPLCLRHRVSPSTRRWARDGMLKTTILMWRLRLAYFFGASPEILARVYYHRDT